ncbi:MAG: hypothetical protein EBU49_13930, partial [Proteobacteria bacterium]|nr:hypothetical protein [Pseudomonadota bacterium]
VQFLADSRGAASGAAATTIQVNPQVVRGAEQANLRGHANKRPCGRHEFTEARVARAALEQKRLINRSSEILFVFH